jgi:ribosomal protein L12E/L44/L45/RPP1/RPP2
MRAGHRAHTCGQVFGQTLTVTTSNAQRDRLYVLVREAQLRGIKPLAIKQPKAKAKAVPKAKAAPKPTAAPTASSATAKKRARPDAGLEEEPQEEDGFEALD